MCILVTSTNSLIDRFTSSEDFYICLYELYVGKGGGGSKSSASLVTVTITGKTEVGKLVLITCSYPGVTKATSIKWLLYQDLLFTQELLHWQKSWVLSKNHLNSFLFEIKDAHKVLKRCTNSGSMPTMVDSILQQADTEFKFAH